MTRRRASYGAAWAQADVPARRHYVVVAVFLLALAVVAGRTGYLTITKRDFLKEQGEVRSVRTVDIPVHRGIIFDRNGEPLAVSAPLSYLWTDPQQHTLTDADLHRLGRVLGIPADKLAQRVGDTGRRFAYLARRLDPQLAERAAALAIGGVHVGREYHRFYPAGETVAHVVGRTDIDDAGQEGIELALDALLAGRPGTKRVLRDNNGRAIKDLDYLRGPEHGKDVYLSLDLRLQFLAYRELKSAVERHAATSASLVMLDVATGEVLALANLPSFNPNDWDNRGVHGVRNRAIADLYEPGSTVKPVTYLAALEAGLFTPDSWVDTTPGYFVVDGKLIEDPLNRGRITVAQALWKSSQVATAKMALAMPDYAVYEALQRAGFGGYTGSELPGEALGKLTAVDLDKPIGRATLAYGYGLSVPPLQIARAYLTLANAGVRKDVTVLLDGAVRGRWQQVFPRRETEQVAVMMRGVLDPSGTAPNGRPSGYTAAGKTGTARKVGGSGYEDTSHVAFFAGFAPAERPRIVLVVVVNEPRRGGIGGGTVAAPIFARVAARALRALGLPPTAPVASTAAESSQA